MVIAVASGKGGTGKTTVSTALSISAQKEITLLDCDVEGANDELFFGSAEEELTAVTVPIPAVTTDLCDGCGKCQAICEYNAIVIIAKKARVYPELCHSCGGCALVCPQQAIQESPVRIGTITKSKKGTVTLVSGELEIGRAMSPPVIREVKKHITAQGINIIDSPPGTSCPMINAIKRSDFAILVTEPTPFGLHDLVLAVRTVRMLGIPFGVIINRCDSGDERVDTYCSKENIEILMKIPDERKIAEAISRGKTILDADESYRARFSALLDRIVSLKGGAA